MDYTPTQTWETDRAHQLAGAAERARIRAEMAGGFTGLSREEALRIGESAQDFHEKWFTMFANIDVDKDGSIDRAELTKALEKNDFLRRTICKKLGVLADGVAAEQGEGAGREAHRADGRRRQRED